MPPTVILDSSYICYRSMYAIKDLSHKEKKTGISFGFLNTVLSLSKKFKTNQFIFCFDSRKSLRKRMYPEYKANRENPAPEIAELLPLMWEQREDLQDDILPAIGFKNVFQQSGYESDDIIADIVMNFDDDFIVVSEDSDLHQLLDNCVIYNLRTKLTLTKDKFTIIHGLEPKQWIMVKAIGGCDTDNVKGITGFAELTTRKYLLGLMKETDKKYQTVTSPEGKAIIERNLKLVSLPMDGFPPVEELKSDKLNLDGFVDMCLKYNFQSFLNNRLDEWKKLLNGENR